MTAVDELIAFVRQQLDEDERVARAAVELAWASGGSGQWSTDSSGIIDSAVEVAPQVLVDEGVPTSEQIEHITRWDPARVLAEVEAKRRILDAASDLQEREGRYAEDFVRALAQPYAGQPGWREEWRA